MAWSLLPDDESSAVVTAIFTPTARTRRISCSSCRDRFGITVAGGHATCDALFRIGHIGWFDVLDITTALAAVELILTIWARRSRAAWPSRAHSATRKPWPCGEGADPESIASRHRSPTRESTRRRCGVALEEIIRYDAIIIRSARSSPPSDSKATA